MHLNARFWKNLPVIGCFVASPVAFTGRADDPAFAPALVEIEEALVPALIVEELDDGSYTVLVPSVPTPMAGAIYILPRERVHPVNVPFNNKRFSKWGAGASDFVRAMRETTSQITKTAL
jgi:hypothetical protein